jgi:hypothetical protein
VSFELREGHADATHDRLEGLIALVLAGLGFFGCLALLSFRRHLEQKPETKRLASCG